jgi:hypothetical protein
MKNQTAITSTAALLSKMQELEAENDRLKNYVIAGYQEGVEELSYKLGMAKKALKKLLNDRSPPWDNLDYKRVAREALKLIGESEQ